MNTHSPAKSLATLGMLRAAACLLLCWFAAVTDARALPPQINTQPTNQTVQVGDEATLAVGATTSGSPLSYQWYFQTGQIPGATNHTYTRANVQLAHTGDYSVAVTNADGGLLSANAILTVVPHPVVTTDNISSTNRSAAASVSFNHTTGAGTNRLLLVGVSLFYGSGRQVSAIAYGGQALTLVGAQTDGGNQVRAEIWRLVNPPSVTTNILVTLNGNTDGFIVGAMTFTGVNQINPLGTFASASGSSPTPSVSLASGPGELGFDTVAFKDGQTLNVGANQGQRWSQTDANNKLRGAGSTEIGAASVTLSWSQPEGAAKEWAIGAVAIKPAIPMLITNTEFSASQDTYLGMQNADLNYGAAPSLVVDRESGDLQRAALQFNLNNIPTNATVTSATLKLQATQISGLLNLSVYELLQSWAEGAGTGTPDAANWTQRASGTNWTTAGGTYNPIASANLNTNATGQHAWNITALVQAWVNESRTNHGLLVASPDGGGTRMVTYASREGAIPPVLAITYATPILPQPDVATTVSGPTSVFAATNFSYTITVTNSGAATATNLVVSDTLPAGIKVVSVSGGGLVVGGGPGQVLFDRASSNHVSGVTNWTHVTGNAANRLLLVGVSFGNSGATSNSAVTALTYGGVNLSKVKASTNATISSELWQLVNPPSGSHSVSITRVGAPTTLVAGAATFSGVDPATPLSTVLTDSGLKSRNPSITLNSATNEVIFDHVTGDKGVPPVAASGQVQLWSIGYSECGGASIRPGAEVVTTSWIIQNSAWAHIAASVKPAGLVGVVNWTIPSLAGGATTNFTITITSPLTGTLSNAVASTADTDDSNVANNDGSAPAARVVTTVQPIADLVTTQSGRLSAAPLVNYTYTVTVSNQGPSTANNVTVSDSLAPTLTFVSASGGGAYLAGVVTWPVVASLARGESTTFTVTVRSPLSGILTNTAASLVATADPNSANNNGSAPAARVVTVVTPLQIESTSRGASVQTLNWSHTVAPGSSRILIVGVSIDSTTATVNAATFNNLLPLTLIGQTNGPQTKVLLYRLLNPPVGTFSVSINLSTAVGIVGGAASFNGVNQANPITGFAGNRGTGSNASLTVASTLGGVVIDTVAPKSPQFATNPSPAQTLEWNLSGADYSGAGGSSYGALTVSPAWMLDSPTSWAMGAVALNPATILSDITLSAAGPVSVLATSNLTYTITVTNLGSAAATNLVVSDVLPAGATFVSASPGGTNNNGVVSWPALTNFITGDRTNYSVTIQSPATGTLTNIVYSTAVTADPDPSNNNGTGTGNQVLTTITPLAEVATTVTGPASVLATADFSYTVTVTNTGPSPASDLVVSDPLPAGVTFLSASGDGTFDAGVVTWSLASLESGATTNFTLTVTAPVSGTLLNTVASTSTATDLVPANNDGSAPAAQVLTTVAAVADLTTTVTGPAIAITNVPFSYSVTVTNLGPSDATSIAVSNTLPAGVNLLTASSGGTDNAGLVTWFLASLPSGATTNFSVTVFAPAIGSLTNRVFGSAVTGDPDLSNNDGTTVGAQVVTEVYPFLLLTWQTLPSGGFQVEFHTYADTLVTIQASTNLVAWDTLITTNSGDGHVLFMDPDTTNHPMRFYRSRQGP